LAWSTVAIGSSAGPSAVERDREALPAIQIGVRAPRHTSSALVSQMCAEADAIWKSAGITFEWRRVTSADAVRTWSLGVTIDEQPHDGGDAQLVLGWIPFTSAGPQPSIHLSRLSAEELLVRTPGVQDTALSVHQRLVGRALGRALSHEIGHYLLQSRVHTLHGLMRAVRSSDEFFRANRDGFEPSAEERDVAALHVRQVLAAERRP
jgi:hypothetical protein